MIKNELAFAKQAALATKDWDTYQAILRKCLASPDFSPVEVAVYARREARCYSCPMHHASATLQTR
jgi:hypothetical protein